jgi:ATP-dependent Clp protease ATP-binding subunit ClpA
MFERFTPDARAVVVHAQQHARRLGHRYIGCEHLLLAVAGTEQVVGVVLRERGVTADRVEQQIVHQVGLGAGASLFADLDRDALAAIGIDLDAVRARVEARFGSEAITRATQVRRRRSRRNPVRGLPPRLRRRVRRWRCGRRTMARDVRARPAPATGRYRAADAVPSGHLPFTCRAKKTLELALREAVARHDAQIGVEHVALGLLAVDSGLVPPILAALGTTSPILRAAIQDRYRQAS